MTWSQPWARATSAFASVDTVPMTVRPSSFAHCETIRPDAAGRGVQQDRVARAQRPDAAHQVRRRESAHRHRRRRLAGDLRRQLDQRRRRDDPLGAVRAERVEEAGVGHAVAGRDVGHAVADRLDDAGRFDAHAVRQRNRIEPGAEVRVGEIEADRDVAKPRLARARARRRRPPRAAGPRARRPCETGLRVPWSPHATLRRKPCCRPLAFGAKPLAASVSSTVS